MSKYPKICIDCNTPTSGQRQRCRSCGCRLGKLGEKNPLWAGGSVGYTQLHRWVESRMPKPELCPRCNERKAYDLTCKGIYSRDLSNWEWMCRRCHMVADGRLNNFIKGTSNPTPSARLQYIKMNGI